jgi:multidrug efflux pump subunit AcrB
LQNLSDGLELQVVLDQSQYVQQRLNGVIGNLIFGSALVIGVSLLILGWKSALIVGLALPLTTLMVFGWMKVLAVPLHQMSVTGIIIALGLLIDNAIIVVDEVQGRLRQGLRPCGDSANREASAGAAAGFDPDHGAGLCAHCLFPRQRGGIHRHHWLTVILALVSSLACP